MKLKISFVLVSVLMFLIGCGDDQLSNLYQTGSDSNYGLSPTTVSSKIDSSDLSFPNNLIGWIGGCSAGLISKRIVISSAHCLVQDQKIKPEALYFLISDVKIPVETIVFRSSDISNDPDPNSTDIFNDWALIVLKKNKYTSSIKSFLSLSSFNPQAPQAMSVYGTDQQANKIKSKFVDIKNINSLYYTNYSASSAKYSGLLLVGDSKLVGLLSTVVNPENEFMVEESFYARTPNDPTMQFDPTKQYAINVAIPVFDTMVIAFNAVEQVLGSWFTSIPFAIKHADFTDSAATEMVVVDVKKNFKAISNSTYRLVPSSTKKAPSTSYYKEEAHKVKMPSGIAR